MNYNNDHINNYSAEDITRYLTGKMLPAEMHAMERAALEDPFLADAIEGMSLAMQERDEQQVIQELEDLRRGFEAKTASPVAPVRYMGWWKVAAAVIVLIGASIWTYDVFVRSGHPSFAQKKGADVPATAPAHADTASASTLIVRAPDTGPRPQDRTAGGSNEPDQKTRAATATKDKATAGENEVASAEQAGIEKKKAGAERSAPTVSDQVAQNTGLREKTLLSTNRDKENAARESFSPPVTGDATKEAYAPPSNARVQKTDNALRGNTYPPVENNASTQRNMLNATTLNSFNGRVVDANNKPISGATVNVPLSNMMVITDEQGKFNVPAPDSTVTVSASAVGYMQRQFNLKLDSLSNQLRLQPSTSSLDEVVVAGYGKDKKKNSRLAKVLVQSAQPVVGWDKYRLYIDSSKKAPSDNPHVTGDVVLSFTVDRTGIPQNIRVEQSLAKGYDEDAIRLVREGPLWKLLNGRKTRATLIIHF